MPHTFMLQSRNLSKSVTTVEGELTILRDINFHLTAGHSLAISGASGSGKSTLLGLLAGLDLPSQGEVILDGTELTALDEDGRAAIRAQKVGFVFQAFQLLPGLTALENVMLPMELQHHQGAAKRARSLLEQVGLRDRLHHYTPQLSGGEQQRVAVARSFACKPSLLFADEPTGNLDTATGGRIIDLLFELNREHGTTLVFVTHEQRLADRCDFQLKLEAGCILPDQSSPEVL